MSALLDHLQAIRDEHGSLTPALVVDTARDPEHPLHSRFEWDDSVAAERWRLEQASQLLRVTYRPDPKKPTELRAFQAIRGEDSHRADYMPTDEVAADPFLSKLALRQMEREFKTFKRRWSDHAEYFALIRAEIEGNAS